MKKERKIFAAFATIFLVAFYLPLANDQVTGAIIEAFGATGCFAVLTLILNGLR